MDRGARALAGAPAKATPALTRTSFDRRALLVAVAAIALGAACSRKAPTPSSHGPAARVVSLSPNTTETMFALGAGALLVGRSRYCDYPPEVAKLPSVGGYVDANLEAILALSPDLVVGARGPSGPGLVETLAGRGIATYFPRTESMAEIDAMIAGLATRLGREAEGRALVAKVREERERVARAVEGAERPRVLLMFDTAPVVVAGPGSFPDEMLRLAGGTNAVTRGASYPTLGLEHVLALDPDVVLDASMTGAGIGHADLSKEPGLRELRAVKTGRVAALHDEAVLRPGPRVGEGLRKLAQAIHPERAIP